MHDTKDEVVSGQPAPSSEDALIKFKDDVSGQLRLMNSLHRATIETSKDMCIELRRIVNLAAGTDDPRISQVWLTTSVRIIAAQWALWDAMTMIRDAEEHMKDALQTITRQVAEIIEEEDKEESSYG